MPRFPMEAFPEGWYALAFSRELRAGALQRTRFAGRERILFRGESGALGLLDAHCPHMGAHFAVGGRVEGELLRCPMHGFAFDPEGHCRKTGYGTKPPPACRAQSAPVVERNGVVLAFHSPSDAAPAWTPPERDLAGYGALRTHLFRDLVTHPQETTENSVDLGHLSVVHGYVEIDTLEPLRLDGPYLTTRYGMRRRAMIPGTRDVRTEFTVHVHGLGLSMVDLDVISHGVKGALWVLPTPTDEGRVDLRLASCVRADSAALRLLPRWLLDATLGALVMRGYVADVEQDIPIWENKAYVDRPPLAQGDGPVGRYRSWTRQFYPGQAALTE